MEPLVTIYCSTAGIMKNVYYRSVIVWLRPATKVPRGRHSPCWGAEENGKKQAETGGSG